MAFKPEPFWTVKVCVENGNEKADFAWERGRLFDKMSCVVLYEKMLDSSEAEVKAVTRSDKKKYRPRPLNTIEFQKLASRMLKISSAKAMDIAEKLYQQGFISYPRTETDRFTPTINLRNLVQKQSNSNDWGDYANRLLVGEQWAGPRNGPHDDKSHPPIHPVKLPDRNRLDHDMWRVYELIARHFLGSMGKDAEGAETKVEIEIAEEIFTARGLTVLRPNYL